MDVFVTVVVAVDVAGDVGVDVAGGVVGGDSVVDGCDVSCVVNVDRSDVVYVAGVVGNGVGHDVVIII